MWVCLDSEVENGVAIHHRSSNSDILVYHRIAHLMGIKFTKFHLLRHGLEFQPLQLVTSIWFESRGRQYLFFCF